MTGAEKVLQWMEEYYKINGTPSLGEVIAQLGMAIEEEKKGQELPSSEAKKLQQCESIWREKDTHLIAAAPKMLEALQNLENDANQIHEHAWKMVSEAISCALTNDG